MKPATTSRRDFIRILGTAGVITAAGGLGASCTSVPASATAPWRRAGDAGFDLRHRVLSYALLAPNPHNRQPWIVDLSRPGIIDLYCDRSRLLPETDPYSRQIVIGHGCFLEQLSLAAGHHGHYAEIEPFPRGAFSPDAVDDRPVARVRLVPDTDTATDPLFGQITRRRTNKEPYDTSRPVPESALRTLGEAIPPNSGMRLVTVGDPAGVARLREMIWRGMEVEIGTPRTYQESIRLMRIGGDEIAANPDGIDLGGTMIEFGKLFGLITRESLADPESSAFRTGLDIQRELAMSAMAFGWLIAPGNSREDQLAAGQAYARLNLKATSLKLDMHPWSQLLQEYPEMASLRQEFFELSGQRGGERTQMLFRMGYGPQVPPSPRWPVSHLLRA